MYDMRNRQTTSTKMSVQMFLLCSVMIFCLTVEAPAKAEAQMCLPNLPPFTDPSNDAPLVDYQKQVIVTSYQFNCCGQVTEWGAYVQPGGDRDEGLYSIKFQVWRPNGQCYSSIGNNEFTSVTLTPNSVIKETPFVGNRIPFQPGDVVGFYLDSPKNAGRDGRGVQLDMNRDQEDVWYGDLGSDGNCPFSIGDPMLLSTNLAPIIHVAMLTTDCPVTTSQYTTLKSNMIIDRSTPLVAVSTTWTNHHSTTIQDKQAVSSTHDIQTYMSIVEKASSSTHGTHTHMSIVEQALSSKQNIQPAMSSIEHTQNTSKPATPTTQNQLHIILPVVLSVLTILIVLIVIVGIWVTWRKQRQRLTGNKERSSEGRNNNYQMRKTSATNLLHDFEQTLEQSTDIDNIEPYAVREDLSLRRMNSEPNTNLETGTRIEAYYAVTIIPPSQCNKNDITTKENVAYSHPGAEGGDISTTSNQAYTTACEVMSTDIPTEPNEAYDTCDSTVNETTENEAFYHTLEIPQTNAQEPIYNSIEDIATTSVNHDYSYMDYETYDYIDD